MKIHSLLLFVALFNLIACQPESKNTDSQKAAIETETLPKQPDVETAIKPTQAKKESAQDIPAGKTSEKKENPLIILNTDLSTLTENDLPLDDLGDKPSIFDHSLMEQRMVISSDLLFNDPNDGSEINPENIMDQIDGAEVNIELRFD